MPMAVSADCAAAIESAAYAGHGDVCAFPCQGFCNRPAQAASAA